MRVRFTRAAQRDLAKIHTYISQDSPVLASRFIARLIERSRQLADNPFEGRETDEPNARVIVAALFHFYTVSAGEIHVTHFRHTSRQRPVGLRPAKLDRSPYLRSNMA
jgi:plasmid stabilization system protein ParE